MLRKSIGTIAAAASVVAVVGLGGQPARAQTPAEFYNATWSPS